MESAWQDWISSFFSPHSPLQLVDTMQNGDIKLSRGAGSGAGWEEMLSLIWLAPTSSGRQMGRFDIITEQLKLIECNYTVEIHRQCRPQCGPRSHAMCMGGRALTLCSVSVSAWFLSNWCKAWLWGRGSSDSVGGSQSHKKLFLELPPPHSHFILRV